MTVTKNALVPTLLGGLLAAGLTALPSGAVAAGDPVVADSGETITYEDPSLAREETTTVEGTLRVAYADRIDGAGRPVAEMAYAVETSDGETVPVELGEDLPEHAANGQIEAEVVDAGTDDAQVSEASVDPAAEEAGAFGTVHRAYVVLVPKTGSMPTESAAANRLASNVLNEWVDESDGGIASFRVADTATLASSAPSAYSASDLCRMTSAAMQGRGGLWEAGIDQFPGVDFSARSSNHLIMLTSSDCTSGSFGIGIGTVGTGIDSGGVSTLLWDSRYIDATGVHEIGHNFGLGHANVEGVEYYDIYSVMGFGTAGGQAPALDSLFRDRLGITVSGEIARPASDRSTTYTLSARGLDSGVRGLAIDDPDSGQTFWVDYRANAGRDAGSTFLGRPVFRFSGASDQGLSYAPGVVLYQAGDAAGGPARAIDVIKREAGQYDGTSLAAGQTFTAPSNGVRVTVLSTTDASARVKVDMLEDFTASASTIEGSLRVGQTVTAVNDSFSPEPTSYRYQWYWKGSTAIPGATSKNFTITSAYAGQKLRVRVIGDRAGYLSRGALSANTAAISAGTMASSKPTISGEVRVGNTLRAVVGSYSPRPTTWKFQWYAGAEKIPGAVWSRYTVTSAYQGQELRVRIMGYRSGYAANKEISTFSVPVLAHGRFSMPAPKISGQLQVGRTVTAKVAYVSPAPTSYRYQWYWKGNKKIPGATKASFRIPTSLAGQKIRVQVTAVRGGFASRSTISGDWARVKPGQMSATRPTIRGNVEVGSTLKAVVGSYDYRPTKWKFQWYAGARKIPGAVWSRYTVEPQYAGQKLRVRVMGYRYGYSPKKTISIFSAPVTR